MSATPYIPAAREDAHQVARALMLRRWLATLAELAALAVFVGFIALVTP